MRTADGRSTLRDGVKLPPMPGESEAAYDHPGITMMRSRIVGDDLIFAQADGFARSLAQGFFLVEIPHFINLKPGDLFARHFFEERRGDAFDHFRGYRNINVPGHYQGFFDREHDQWENFYIEMANWALLPPELALLGHQMTDLGVTILRNVFRYLGLPESDWAKATSGLSEKRGHHMFGFNHFRSERAVRGSKFHRDSGWVTILRSFERGLLALVDDRLCAVNPEPGHFIVNFGSSIEVLTGNLCNPVRANIHGVVRTERTSGLPDRTSYVVFLDSNLAGTIYCYENGELLPVQSVAEFAIQEVSRTYGDDDKCV